MRTRLILTSMAVAALALSACSRGEEAKAPEASATATPAGPVSRDAVYAAAVEGPEPFVRMLYAQYVVNGGPMGQPPPPGRDPLYDRMLNAMIGEDVRKAGEEVPTLNYDPICGCQDTGDFRLDSVTVTQSGPQAAEAAVVFTNMGETKRQTLKLVKEGRMWKVSDVLVAGEKPLTEQLMAAIS